jgi:hypothetical protein
LKEKKAITGEVSKRYQKSGKKEKSVILNELTKTTGYNRKYVLHVLANWGKTAAVRIGGETVRLKASPSKRRKGGGRKPKYFGDFVILLRKVWAFFSYRCGKILAPFMREQMGFLQQPFCITEENKKLLLSVSPSTIDRLLKQDKKKLALKGKSRASSLKSRFPSALITPPPTKSQVSLKLILSTTAEHRIRASSDFSPMPHPHRHRRVFRLGRTSPYT